MTRAEVPIPAPLDKRPRDRRGLPIPWVNLIDAAGKPHFTINDHEKVEQAARESLCGLCGERLTNGGWFVGGPLCFGERGAFVDPHMHEDCAKYALQVCPFIAVKGYNKRIDAKLLKEEDKPEGMRLAELDMPPEQPVFFGLGQVRQMEIHPHGPGMLVFVPSGSPKFLTLEWWRFGEKIRAEDAVKFFAEHVQAA
jgi:hypothetical protein